MMMSAVRPMAAPIFTGGNTSGTTANIMGRIRPVPMPCTRRPASMISKLGAAPLITEPTENALKREQRKLAHAEPFHKQAGERQNNADDQHISNNHPLHDGRLHAEGGGKLRQGDVQGRFAEHAREAAQVQAHHGEVGVRRLDARLAGIKTLHIVFCAFLSDSGSSALSVRGLAFARSFALPCAWDSEGHGGGCLGERDSGQTKSGPAKEAFILCRPAVSTALLTLPLIVFTLAEARPVS